MARPLAADHDDKRRTILKASAVLFARNGFDRTSISEIAAACGVSKALLYHYFDTKEQVLVAIIRQHLDDLLAAVAEADDVLLQPRQRLRALIGAVLDCYRDADNEHKIQINELSRLPADISAELIEIERLLVRRFSAALVIALPRLKHAPEVIKPVTMTVFGMLNWNYMWFRDNGPVSRSQYSDLLTDMIIGGAEQAVERFAGPDAVTPKIRPL